MNYSRFLQYAHWANLRLLDMLRANPKVESKALALFAHLLAAEHIWLCRLQKKASDTALWPELGLDECETLLEMTFAGYENYFRSMNENSLADLTDYQTTNGLRHQTPVSDVLMHVFGHSQYHRGQIANSIKRNGGEVLNTDYIAFVREIHSA